MSKLIFEKSTKGQKAINLGCKINAESIIPQEFLRESAPTLPEVSELDAMRHFTELSQKNFCIEKGFYPLGSCTMKYNPKVNEYTSGLEGFTNTHPLQDDSQVQGCLELMYELQQQLKTLTGMDAITLQPAAGAHGELTGMLMVKKYFEAQGEKRTKVIVPDSAHGTNPATARMCGFQVIEIKSNDKGQVDIDTFKKVIEENAQDIAAIMLTNPNTLGLFEENILEISELAHKNGSLLYYDGANLNAIMGITTPAKMGFDIVHLNLHKTFSTPHGGGGPGAGPVGVVDKLKDFLPTPLINFDGEKYYKDYNVKESIGAMKAFYGNFNVLIRAYTYILMMGKDGLKNATCDAVLNANYIKEKLKNHYNLPYDITCMHEFVLSAEKQKEEYNITTLNIAKRMIDYGVHPPTVYFPLIVPEAMMIEPTETENKKTIDDFIEIMIKIASEIKEKPELLTQAPQNAPVKKVDETYAARNLNLKYEEK